MADTAWPWDLGDLRCAGHMAAVELAFRTGGPLCGPCNSASLGTFSALTLLPSFLFQTPPGSAHASKCLLPPKKLTVRNPRIGTVRISGRGWLVALWLCLCIPLDELPHGGGWEGHWTKAATSPADVLLSQEPGPSTQAFTATFTVLTGVQV